MHCLVKPVGPYTVMFDRGIFDWVIIAPVSEYFILWQCGIYNCWCSFVSGKQVNVTYL